jgi:hypothetical protein
LRRHFWTLEIIDGLSNLRCAIDEANSCRMNPPILPEENAERRQLLEYLHILLAHNVIGDKQYDSRYKGFRGELEFLKWFHAGNRNNILHAGGYLLPVTAKSETTVNPVYFTITSDAPDAAYAGIYQCLSRLPCAAMYFIRYDKNVDFSGWKMEDLLRNKNPMPVPPLEIFQYDPGKNQFHRLHDKNENRFLSFFRKIVFQPSRQKTALSIFLDQYQPEKRHRISATINAGTKQHHIDTLIRYNTENLLDLYVQRLVFDGMIGFGRQKGIPSDIDFILCQDDQPFFFIEVKEKDLSKKEPRGFGIDLHRLESLRKITRQTGVPYSYAVRRVNNQTERKFVEWLKIDVEKFNDCVKDSRDMEGGTGMRSESSSNPTRICPYAEFTVLE